MKIIEMIENIFPDFTVIAGEEGISRKISSVNVADAPDIYNWIKGGEFLISTGYILKEDPGELTDLIIKLNANGAAALGIKLKRFIDELPQEVMQIANQLHFPLISIPIQYSFAEVINSVLTELVNKQARSLLYSQKIHQSFTDLAIKGGGIEPIITTLADFIGVEVIYVDTYFDRIYSSYSSNEFLKKIERKKLVELLTVNPSFSIRVDKKQYGHIIINYLEKTEEEGEYEQIALEHASTVIKLEIQKKISNMQIEMKHRDEFFQDIILNNVKSFEDVKYRADLYGFDLNEGTIVVILDIDSIKVPYQNNPEQHRFVEQSKDQVIAISQRWIKNSFERVFYTSFSDSVIFLIQSKLELFQLKEEIKKVNEKIRKQILKEYKFTVMIGVGRYYQAPELIHLSYQEAKKAVQLGRTIFKKDRTVFYDQLGAFKLLEAVSKEEAHHFCEEYLGPLIQHDRQNDANLLETLIGIVACNWNLKQTADQIFIHYNTMKNRFQKICEVLQLDLALSENRLNLMLALKLLKMADE